MRTRPLGPTLFRRGVERDAVEGVLRAARNGHSAALVLRGGAGSGKTTLLEYAIEQSADLGQARVIGIESEMPLSFAALHQLMVPFLAGLHRVPAPQRDALGAAFGSVAGTEPNRFLIGLAVLTLIANAAANKPLLVVVDDAQWLDHASVEVLAFVARRLRIAGVALLVGVRDSQDHPLVAGLPTLHLGGSPDNLTHYPLVSVANRLHIGWAPDREVLLPHQRGGRMVLSGGDDAAAASGHAAQLEPDDGQQTQRLLAVSHAELTAGAPGQALAALDQLPPQLEDRLSRARTLQLRGAIRFTQAEFADAPSILLRAASEMHAVDAPQAREVFLEGLWAGLVAGRFAAGDGAHEIVRAARALRIRRSPTTAADLLLDGFAARLTEGYTAGAPLLRASITRLRVEELPWDRSRRWMALSCVAAQELLDDEALDALARRWMRADRERGAQGTLPAALGFVAGADLSAGRFAAAEAHLVEARDIAVGRRLLGPECEAGLGHLLVLAWRGQEADARAAVAQRARECNRRGLGAGITVAQCALAVLELALGRYDAALACARNVYRYDPPALGTQVLPDLVEAACRSRDRPAAVTALDRFVERAQQAGTPFALGLLARCQALLGGNEAENLHQEGIDHLQRSPAAGQLARSHLVYGEWLRRQRRRRDAREQLRAAHEMFDSMGAEGFAQRARLELVAAGERVHNCATDTSDYLTPQETHIARLVAAGESNPEIAARLFISRHTVEYHLGKVFRKLGVNSRTKLARVLHEQGDGPVSESSTAYP